MNAHAKRDIYTGIGVGVTGLLTYLLTVAPSVFFCLLLFLTITRQGLGGSSFAGLFNMSDKVHQI